MSSDSSDDSSWREGDEDETMSTSSESSEEEEFQGDAMSEAMQIAGKADRSTRVHEIRDVLKPQMEEAFPEMTENEFFHLFDEFEIQVVRKNVLDHGNIRVVTSEVSPAVCFDAVSHVDGDAGSLIVSRQSSDGITIRTGGFLVSRSGDVFDDPLGNLAEDGSVETAYRLNAAPPDACR